MTAALRQELERQGISHAGIPAHELVVYSILTHFVRCERRADDVARELKDNTAMTRETHAFLKPKMQARNDWIELRAMFKKLLSGLTGFLDSDLAKWPLRVIAGSGFGYVTWRVGGWELVGKMLHWLF